jgi:hypothetical protein
MAAWPNVYVLLSYLGYPTVNKCCGCGSGIRCLFDPLDPGSGMGKKSGSGSGKNIPDDISESLMRENPFLGPLEGVGPENRDFFGT